MIKEKISQFLESLKTTLTFTREGEDIEKLDMLKKGDEDFIVITFKNGFKKTVNVTADSEFAIIQDVLKRL